MFRWTLVASVLVLVTVWTPTAAADPGSAFIAEYLAGKVLDGVWDAAGGKPDVALLDARLKELEGNAVMRAEMREEVRRLRQGITDRVTRDEFKAAAERTGREIASIRRRLAALEERVERLEVENEDGRNGTKNAASADYFGRRGERFAKAGDADRALANYAIALGLDPSHEPAYRGRCEVYRRLGAWGVVVVAASDAVGRLPASSHPWFCRERAYARGRMLNLKVAHLVVRLSGEVKGMAGAEAAEFMSDCERALADRPADADLLTFRGLHLLCAADAAKPAWKRRTLAKEESDRWYKETMALRKALWERARADFDAAVKADKTCYLAYCGRGVATRQADFTPAGRRAATEDFSAAIRLDPGRSDAYALRGACNSGDPAAIADLDKALQIEPKDIYLLEERAKQHSIAKDDRNAIADYLRIVEIDPANEGAHSMLSSTYYHLGDKAKSEYHQARLEEIRRSKGKKK